MTSAKRAAEKIGGFGVLVTLALVAAFLQSPLTALAPSVGAVSYLDDGFLALMLIACLPYLGKAPGAPVMLIGLWVALMTFAAVRSTLDPGGTFIVFRQVVVPALLILVGLALTAPQWYRVKRVTIWLGIINAIYMGIEAVGVHILDPHALETFNAGRGEDAGGLPSYYRYWVGDSFGGILGVATLTRLGGTLLNPPMAGLLIATALVFLWHDRAFRARKFWLAIFGVCLLFTFARGGWVIALIALVVPFLLRKAGRIATFVVVLPALWIVGTQLAEAGSSARHTDGLTTGIAHGVTSPLGEGFGLIGNYVKSLHIAEASESLAGIAFAAAGIPAMALVVVLMIRLWNVGGRHPQIWEASMGLAILIAALLSESAGGLNGTMALWMGVGVALKSALSATRESNPGRIRTGALLKASTSIHGRSLTKRSS